MPNIDRNSVEAAKNITEHLLKNKTIRTTTLSFLFGSIKYANSLNPENWNLNLDKTGQFIRFNVGHVYCFEIFRDKINIICLKKFLKKQILGKNIDITFKGYDKKKIIKSKNLDQVPDCLVKVPDSVGCYIDHNNIIDYIDIFREPHFEFIKYGILNTTQLPAMKNAHSIGFIEFLNEHNFTSEIISTKEDLIDNIIISERVKAKKLDINSLKKKATSSLKIATKTHVEKTQFVRNQYVVEYAKRLANGICQDCLKPAPFKNKIDGEPFLETHHIIPLSDEGEDTIENTIALCPNCHRKRHYGK